MPLTADRMTGHQETDLAVIGVAATTKIFGGGMVAKNAAGFGVPAADSAGLKVIGVSDEQVDNLSGANGDEQIIVRRKKVFGLKNSATNPVTAANLFGDVYVEDDETISSVGGTNSIVAGILIGVGADGAAVEIG